MQDRDFEWFLENYNDLYDKYGRSFLAIKNEKVLGVYSSFNEAVDATLLSEEIGTFIVQECNGNESAYTVQIASMHFM
jgi:hypothetical protein